MDKTTRENLLARGRCEIARLKHSVIRGSRELVTQQVTPCYDLTAQESKRVANQMEEYGKTLGQKVYDDLTGKLTATEGEQLSRMVLELEMATIALHLDMAEDGSFFMLPMIVPRSDRKLDS